MNGIADLEHVSKEITDYFSKTKAERKEILNGLLLVEELSIMFFQQFPNSSLQIKVLHKFGDLSLQLCVKGEEFNPLELAEHYLVEKENQYRQMIFQANKEKLNFSYKNGTNLLSILVHSSGQKRIYYTLFAMFFGTLMGIAMKNFLPGNMTEGIDYNFFQVIKTLFLNSLKMMIAPVVFFSIASSISNMSDISEVGKMGGKLLLTYFLTTVLAILLGFGIACLVLQGKLPDINMAAQTFSGDVATVSIRDTIVNIVPSDLISPITGMKMLQIIFVAVLFGVGIGKIGEQVRMISDLNDSMNKLCLQVVSILIRFMPLASFCAMASMMIHTGAETLLVLVRFLIGLVLGWVGMIGIYSLLLLIIGRISPLPFIKKIIPFSSIPFSLGSSNASIPFSLNFCKNKLGIDEKLSSFSIPIGATVNMDGSCIYLVLGSVMFLKLNGIEIDPSMILTISVSTFILSVGAPGVPGGGLICLTTLVAALGLPMDCIGIVIGIDQLTGMIRTASNTGGDIAVTAMIANRQNMLDHKIYHTHN